MGVQVAAMSPPCAPSSSSSPQFVAARSLFLGIGCIQLSKTRSSGSWKAGLSRPRRGQSIRRSHSASLESIGSGDDEFVWRLREMDLGLQLQGCGGDGGQESGWPASVERSASSVGLPLSLRMLKRKKRLMEAGESACSSVRRAFSSMVFIIRELHSFTLHMRQAILYEDIQSILARVQGEMHASFVWLFQHIFSCTPTLMVSVMLLLANFTVYSMGNTVAAAGATPPPPPQSTVASAIESHCNEKPQPRFDASAVKTFSIGRTASVGGGSGRGGGNVRPVAGATDDGRSDDSSASSYRQSRTVFPQGVSPAATVTVANEEDDEVAVWDRIGAEASRMQASVRDEALMDPDVLKRLVAPVRAELETDDYAEYLRTEQRYEQAVSEDPENSLILSNFAQFLYLVLQDDDRAEHYFKRAVKAEPADAETLSRYATFLWKARNDLGAAEETFQDAIAADPSNAYHAANYAHFLWNTGGEDTCYPLDG